VPTGPETAAGAESMNVPPFAAVVPVLADGVLGRVHTGIDVDADLGGLGRNLFLEALRAASLFAVHGKGFAPWH